MAKQKKKRNKAYQGSGAKTTQPVVMKMTAANRSAMGQWWFEKKRLAKPALIAAAVAIIVVWLVVELLRVISG